MKTYTPQLICCALFIGYLIGIAIESGLAWRRAEKKLKSRSATGVSR